MLLSTLSNRSRRFLLNLVYATAVDHPSKMPISLRYRETLRPLLPPLLTALGGNRALMVALPMRCVPSALPSLMAVHCAPFFHRWTVLIGHVPPPIGAIILVPLPFLHALGVSILFVDVLVSRIGTLAPGCTLGLVPCLTCKGTDDTLSQALLSSSRISADNVRLFRFVAAPVCSNYVIDRVGRKVEVWVQ